MYRRGHNRVFYRVYELNLIEGDVRFHDAFIAWI